MGIPARREFGEAIARTLKHHPSKLAGIFGALILAYLAARLAVYMVVMNFNFGFVFEYLRLGWTGGGELPTFIQLGALLVTALVAMAAGPFAYFRARRRPLQSGTNSPASQQF